MNSRMRRRILITMTVAVLVVALAGGLFVWWFLRDDAPDRVDIGRAAEQVATETTLDAVAETAPLTDTPLDTSPDTPLDTGGTGDDGSVATGTGDGIQGTWTVDTTIGEFDYESSTGTFVGFRVDEELSGIGSTTAVGRTPEVTGAVEIDSSSGAATITTATVEADLSVLTTNDSRRDDRARGALGTNEHPLATFALLEPIDLPAGADSGEAVTATAHGELMISGVTQVVDIVLDAQLVGDTIVIVGSLDVTFADYGVTVPSAPIVVSADDHGVIELQLFLTR